MNYLSWADLAAYLDWSCLRPMTELEFEKICRGTMARVAGEYPWGTTDLNGYFSTSIVAGTGFRANENIATIVNGRCMFSGQNVVATSTYGPARVGMFATSSSGRSSSGAAYYGVMDMSGNVWERKVVY
jgi:formylglycine-generating enzyme required for sulfatase activity